MSDEKNIDKTEIPENWDGSKPGWNPLLAIRTIGSTMNELMTDIFYQAGKPPFEVFWQPPLDLYCEGDLLFVEIALAGIEKESVEIHATPDLLIIQGKPEPVEEKERKYFIREKKTGHFLRSVPLPFKVIPEKVKAAFERGILRVTLPMVADKPNESVKIKID